MQPSVLVFLTIVGLRCSASLIEDDPRQPRMKPVAGLNNADVVYIGWINGKSFYHGRDHRNPIDAKIACEVMNFEFAKVETQEELDFIAARTTYYYPWTAGVYTPVAQHADGSLVDPLLEIAGDTEDVEGPRALMIQRDTSPANFYAYNAYIATEYICMTRNEVQ